MVEYAATQGISDVVRGVMVSLLRNNTVNSIAGDYGAIAAPL
jgi:hypothetical protein